MAAVDPPQAATPVEIQLTPNEESRLRRRRLAGTGAEVVAHDHSSDFLPPEDDATLTTEKRPPAVVIERRTLVIVATLVAVVAFFLGWALGRSGDSSGSEQGHAETSAADTAPSETFPLAEVPTTLPVRNSPVIRAVPTTTFSEWQTETVEVHPALAALGLDVVMVGGTQIAELDAATGELRTLTLSSGIVQPPVVDAGTDWFVIRNFDAGTSQLVRRRRTSDRRADPRCAVVAFRAGYGDVLAGGAGVRRRARRSASSRSTTRAMKPDAGSMLPVACGPPRRTRRGESSSAPTAARFTPGPKARNA